MRQKIKQLEKPYQYFHYELSRQFFNYDTAEQAKQEILQKTALKSEIIENITALWKDEEPDKMEIESNLLSA